MRVYVVLAAAFVLVFNTVNPVVAVVAPAVNASDAFCADTATTYTGVAFTVVDAFPVVDPDVAVNVTLPVVPVVLTV
ncbi:MAG TPA: hypothetical protein VKH19_15855 [Gemmatimonadaceae bacterium]|nr:hypothetical protein [Gemmatimonadaceae bacterium]